MRTVFSSENECTVGKWEFIFNGADSKASGTTEKFKVYRSVDIKFVGVITKQSTWKINFEMLCTAGIQCNCGQWLSEKSNLT